MDSLTIAALLFPVAITLHNVEEALWLPGWSKSAGRFQRPVEKGPFRFAVAVITLLAYAVTGLFLLFPEQVLFRYAFAGFLGAMAVNALFPHLAATLALRKYAPGTLTGLFLMIPVDALILFTMVSSGVLGAFEVLLATAGVGILLAASIPVLLRLGKIAAGTDT